MTKSMSDGGKGSVRRNEDTQKVLEGFTRIFGESKLDKRLREEREAKKMNDDDDGEVICDVCGAEMSPTEHGLYLFCDVCGHREEFEESDDYE